MAPSRAPPGQFSLLYFATASSYTRKASDFLPAPLAIGQLFGRLDAMYPGMKDKVLDSCAVTVNLDYVDLEDEQERSKMIQAGDEVAIIPPVSSG